MKINSMAKKFRPSPTRKPIPRTKHSNQSAEKINKNTSKGLGEPKTGDSKLIVLDESKGLIFENEEALQRYFDPLISEIEQIHNNLRKDTDFNEDDQDKLEPYLEICIDQPSQIWKGSHPQAEFPIYTFVKKIEGELPSFFEIALCYLDEEELVPSFVLYYFATRDESLLKNYCREELVFDASLEGVRTATVEGDALGDGEPLALGLFNSMMVLRSEKDIPQNEFSNYGKYREECIEAPDEIWKKVDTEGHGLVTFIKEYNEEASDSFFYVAVTLEDPQTQVHSLLFSFPTTDSSLVDRYRQGENLQADEVVQESSH